MCWSGRRLEVIVGPIPRSLRWSRAHIVWLGLALATFFGLLLIGRHLTFWQDEWTFIGADTSGIAAYLEPHNEHWSTVPLILYRAILAIVGLHSYLPYMVVLTLLHLAAAGGAFVLLARRLPGWAALLAAIPLLVLGSGSENILWAFQIGFVASVAAGTWGLVALEDDRRRSTAIAGTGLLVVGLASSGMGIFFVVATAVRLFVDPALRRRSAWVVVPGVVFVIWYLTYGRHGVSGGFASPADVIPFAARGLTYAVARVAGFDLAGRLPVLGWVAGLAAILLVVAILARQAVGRLVAPLALGGAVAALTMYLVIGLSRADLPGDFATRSRYVYVAAFLLIPALGDLIGSLSTGRKVPRPATVGLIALAALSIGANVLDLRAGRTQFARDAGLTRAYLTLLADRPADSSPDPTLPLGWPDVRQLDEILQRYGSPLEDTLVPSNVVPPTTSQLEQAVLGMTRGSFSASAVGPAALAGDLIPIVLGSGGAAVTAGGSCLSIVTAAADGWVTLSVPVGGGLLVEGPVDGATASLGWTLPPASRTAIALPTSPTDRWSIAVPDLGMGGLPWQVRLDLPRPVTIRVCGPSR